MVEKMKTDVDRLLLDWTIKKCLHRFCWNFIFFIFLTKSCLSTSGFIFSIISRILKSKFYVFLTQTCRNLKSIKFANLFDGRLWHTGKICWVNKQWLLEKNIKKWRMRQQSMHDKHELDARSYMFVEQTNARYCNDCAWSQNTANINLLIFGTQTKNNILSKQYHFDFFVSGAN